MDAEVALAASYYRLFRSEEGADARQSKNAGEGQPSEAARWEEDEWTAEDAARAEAVLAKHLERCKADPSSLAATSNTLGGEDVDAWDRFYDAHQTNFFKDRHYFSAAFPSEFGETIGSDGDGKMKCLVEVGCGVGNAMLIYAEKPTWIVYGLDLSKTAVELLQADHRFVRAAREGRARAFCSDIVKEPVPCECVGRADVTTLLFCLSAIDPEDHVMAAMQIARTLSENGVLVIRDYGRYDEAQLKLASQRNKMLKDNFYRKSDGTKCYYFSTDDLENLFCLHAGLEILELRYLRRIYRNRQQSQTRRRVWVQARFRKKEEKLTIKNW